MSFPKLFLTIDRNIWDIVLVFSSLLLVIPCSAFVPNE